MPAVRNPLAVRSRTLRWGTPGATVLGVALLALGACASGGAAAAPQPSSPAGSAPSSASAAASAAAALPPGADGHAAVGALTVSGAYLPAPASPDVATAYFTVADSASTADTLLSVSCAQAASAMLHQDVTAGAGADEMVPLKGGLPVPAHGSVTLSPAHGLHVMIMQPKRQWRAGAHVVLVLRFAHAGTVSLTVPVLSTTAVAEAGSGTAAAPVPSMPGIGSMSGMASMSGMPSGS